MTGGRHDMLARLFVFAGALGLLRRDLLFEIGRHFHCILLTGARSSCLSAGSERLLFLRAAADGDFARRGDDAELPCDPFVQFRPGIAAEATGEDLKAGTAAYDAQLS